MEETVWRMSGAQIEANGFISPKILLKLSYKPWEIPSLKRKPWPVAPST